MEEILVRNRVIFSQGVEDYRTGFRQSENPFRDGNQRLAGQWNIGWIWGKHHGQLKEAGKIRGAYCGNQNNGFQKPSNQKMGGPGVRGRKRGPGSISVNGQAESKSGRN